MTSHVTINDDVTTLLTRIANVDGSSADAEAGLRVCPTHAQAQNAHKKRRKSRPHCLARFVFDDRLLPLRILAICM